MRTTMIRGVFAMAIVLAFAAAPALAQSLVRGVVVDEKNQPVDGAVIVFEAVNVPTKRDVKTDRRGEFIFMGLTSGPYKVTASKEGVGSQTQQVEITQTKINMNFTLSAPKPAAAAAGAEALAAGAGGKRDKETAELQALAASATAAYKGGQYQEAVTQFSSLVQKLPTCADCFMFIGNSYVALKQPAEAENAFKQSIAVTPSVEAYTALTRLYNQQKRFDLAAETSKQAADLAAAPAAGAAGAPGEAGAAAPAPSASSETLYNQGVVLWNAGKYAEAKTQFEAAVKANPGNADAQYQLAMANLNLGQIEPARAAFEAYLKAAPEGDKAAQVKAMLAQLPK